MGKGGERKRECRMLIAHATYHIRPVLMIKTTRCSYEARRAHFWGVKKEIHLSRKMTITSKKNWTKIATAMIWRAGRKLPVSRPMPWPRTSQLLNRKMEERKVSERQRKGR